MYAHRSVEKQQARIATLEAEVANLQKQLGDNENAEEIVSKHHKALHAYNETKDAAQVHDLDSHRAGKFLMQGCLKLTKYPSVKLAEQKQTTIRELHQNYGLSKDD